MFTSDFYKTNTFHAQNRKCYLTSYCVLTNCSKYQAETNRSFFIGYTNILLKEDMVNSI